MKGRFPRILFCLAKIDNGFGDVEVEAAALEAVEMIVDSLAHKLMAEVQPIVGAFEQEPALQKHAECVQWILGGGALQEIEAEIAPDDRAQVQDRAMRDRARQGSTKSAARSR